MQREGVSGGKPGRLRKRKKKEEYRRGEKTLNSATMFLICHTQKYVTLTIWKVKRAYPPVLILVVEGGEAQEA